MLFAAPSSRRLALVAGILTLSLQGASTETFRIATYNLEGYLDQPVNGRRAKSPEARSVIHKSICSLNPDILACQEIGSLDALLHLRASLSAAGLSLPFWEFVPGHDTNAHLAVLSRFPISARRSHTNDSFLLGTRRLHVARGFAEVDLQITTNWSLTLLNAHLKSKRTVIEGDESEIRLEEAKLLRAKVDARFAANPDLNLVVLGDFNDTKDSAVLKAIVGAGPHKLTDIRPSERPAGSPPADPLSAVSWTYFYSKADSYARIDYILLSPAMARRWVPHETRILSRPDWALASDHRPLVATFQIEN